MATPLSSDEGVLPTLAPQSLPLISLEFWTSTEVLTNVILAGLFCLLVAVHHIFRWLFHRTKASSFIVDNLTEQRKIISGIGTLKQRSIEEEKVSQRFFRFQKRFMFIYCIAFSVDILGAPYIYYMYSDYHHLVESKIRELMQISFLSTAICNCVLSPVIDMFGRRLGVMGCMFAYAIRYSLVSFSTSQIAFVASQIFYGIAVSLLYSVPDSWMVDQHRTLGFSDELLQNTYTKTNIATSAISVVVSQCAAIFRPFVGLSAIFMAASSVAIINTILLYLLWEENTGDGSLSSAPRQEELDPNLALRLLGLFVSSVLEIFSRIQVLAVGAAYAMMEASIWIFVSLWTPVMRPLDPDAIFPGLMIACALGSHLANLISCPTDSSTPVEQAAPYNDQKIEQESSQAPLSPSFRVAGENGWRVAGEGTVGSEAEDQQQSDGDQPGVSRSIMSYIWNHGLSLRLVVILYQLLAACLFLTLSRSVSLTAVLISCLGIEICIGFQYSAFSNLRAQIIPNKGRVIIYSLFGVPSSILNYIIIGKASEWKNSALFLIAAHYCFIAGGIMIIAWLFRIFRSRRRPQWHPENPQIASSPSQNRRWFFHSARSECSRFRNAITAASLFFRTRKSPSGIVTKSYSRPSQDSSQILSPATHEHLEESRALTDDSNRSICYGTTISGEESASPSHLPQSNSFHSRQMSA